MSLRGLLPLLPILFAGGVANAESLEPPPIEPVRYAEGYAYLRERNPADLDALAPWGRLKFLPLDAEGDVYLTLGAELRLRYERYGDNNWGEGEQDENGYLWARALPLADLHAGRYVRIFVQPITAFALGVDLPPSPVDEDRLDLVQGFLDVRIPLGPKDRPALTLRTGRQLLTYGSGRLIDLRYGPNVPQAFDAAKAVIETRHWRLDAFYARPAENFPGVFDDGLDRLRSLWALYGTLQPDAGPLGLDLFYIGYTNQEAVYAQGAGDELRHTVGLRFFGESRGWDWNAELHYQFGTFEREGGEGGEGAIDAWSVGTDTGYTFQRAPLVPRLGLKANVISGDRDPADVDLETFHPLFPKGRYFGELSPIGPANLIHLNPSLRLDLAGCLRLYGNLAFYLRESVEDAVYSLGALQIVRSGTGDARYIGTQAEVLLESQLGRHVSLGGSYSLFTGGSFVADAGAAETIHFVGLEAQYRF